MINNLLLQLRRCQYHDMIAQMFLSQPLKVTFHGQWTSFSSWSILTLLVGQHLLILWESWYFQLLLLLKLHRPRSWQQQAPLRHQYLFTSRNNVIFHQTWIFTNNTVRTSHLVLLTLSISVTSCSIGPLLWIDNLNSINFIAFVCHEIFPVIYMDTYSSI